MRRSIAARSSAPSPSAAAMRSESPGGERDRDETRADQLAQPARDEIEQRVELELADECGADFVERLELLRPRRRRLVQSRVLDRDGRLRCEQRDELLVLVGEVAACPSRSDRGFRRRRRAARSARRGTMCIGGWPGGKPTERGSSERSCSRSGRASWIRTPRMPRPCGGSPICVCTSGGIPYVTKRSSPLPAGSITPSAAYCAPVTRAAASTMRSSTPSSDSSELIAMPVSTSARRRSVSCAVVMPTMFAESSGDPSSAWAAQRFSQAADRIAVATLIWLIVWLVVGTPNLE